MSTDHLYSVKEMLLSSLSSICCSNASSIKSSLDKREDTIHGLSDILKSSKSVAYILGTHKDRVSDKQIKNLSEEMQKLIESTEFCDLVEFFSEDELIVTMDNMSGSICDATSMHRRSALVRLIPCLPTIDVH